MTQCIRYCVMASLYPPPPFVTHIGRRLFYTAKGFAFGRAVKGFIEVSCESRCV